MGLPVKHVPLPPGEFVTDRLATGTFQVAVADLRIGLDPDLYPLLASSQTLTGGSNIMGVQDPTLDTLLDEGPGTRHRRGPQRRLHGAPEAAGRRVGTCSRWPSRTRWSCSATRSRDPPSGRSPTRRIDFGMC